MDAVLLQSRGCLETTKCPRFNPLKCSGVRWFRLRLFNAIQVYTFLISEIQAQLALRTRLVMTNSLCWNKNDQRYVCQGGPKK